MKNKYTLLAAILFTAINLQVANARVWRVNNKSNYNGTSLYGDNYGGTSSFPVFKQIAQAVGWASVTDNDTLYVEGSTTIYAGTTITKKLAIIGSGYFLTENTKVTNDALESKVSQLTFNISGSQLIGMSVVNTGYASDAKVYINASGITVKRCKIDRGIQFATELTDVYILENFFSNAFVTNVFYTNGYASFIPPTNIVFNNNICEKNLIWNGPVKQCNNNIFNGTANALNLQFTTAEFKNNILMPTNASISINSGNLEKLTYNVGTLSTQFGTANSNKVVSSISTLFVTSGTSDGKYQLKSNSQASNNGSDGTDRGPFGGAVVANRYTLSGLANIPVTYKLTTTGVATPSAGLQVTISARTIK